MHQQTEMEEGNITKRKESQNGSTGHSMDCQNKEKQPKATVLQKDVSVYLFAWLCVRVPENKSH